MLGLGVGVVLLVLFFVPLVAVSGWIESMRKEMKTGFDDLDSRLKAIERTVDGIREELHDTNRKIENSGKIW